MGGGGIRYRAREWERSKWMFVEDADMRAFDDYDTPLESKTERHSNTASKSEEMVCKIT